jgi:hypothetical protein
VEGELLAFHPHVVRNHHTIRLNWNRLFVLYVCSFPLCAPHFLHALLPVAARAVLNPLGNFLGRGKSQLLAPHSINT